MVGNRLGKGITSGGTWRLQRGPPPRTAADLGARVGVEQPLHMKVPNHGKQFKALLRSCLAEGR